MNHTPSTNEKSHQNIYYLGQPQFLPLRLKECNQEAKDKFELHLSWTLWHWQKTIPAPVTLRPDKNLNEKKGHVANPSLYGTIKLGSSQKWDVNSVAYMNQPKSMDASYTWKHSLKAKQVCNGFLTVFSRTAISKQLDNYQLPVVFFWQTWQGFPLAPAEQFQPTNKQATPTSQATLMFINACAIVQDQPDWSDDLTDKKYAKW